MKVRINVKWEQHKLGDFGNVQMNKRIFKSQTLDSGDVPFYKIGTFGKKADAYISSELYEEYRNKYPYPKDGDLLISASGSIGKIVEYKGQRAYYQDSNIVWLDHDNRILNLFLKAFFQIVKWNGTEGSTIKRLYNKNILNTEIILPKIKEQTAIGKLIEKFDYLITLQQRKLEQLKQLKKALLQQLFVDKNSKLPILRFKNFNGDWKKRKLRELGKIVTGNTPKTSQIENYNNNGIPWITPTDIYSTYTTNSSKHLSNIGKERARVAPANSLLITCIASIGKNTLIFQESAFNQQINALIPHNNDSSFLLAESNKWSQIMTNLAGQTSMQIINKKDFSEILTEIPDLSEQKIIGSLFTKLNLFITLQQSKIDQLTILKKYLLQKLFI
ncbi:restriction endonuclease subunit S [Limosilactobacillus reuteri]|nr:restriction endonuclease subunit S [Limosilactobacillus reuteri]MDL2056946.1 restriction endonuclease subunit S [Limosilactobacillus reuteri]